MIYMECHKNEQGKIITTKLSLHKSYLGRLDHLEEYKKWLQQGGKKDNITNCKGYFNTFIFIRIQDFIRADYKLRTKHEFKKYMRKKKPYNRAKAKKENLNIFLREVVYN